MSVQEGPDIAAGETFLSKQPTEQLYKVGEFWAGFPVLQRVVQSPVGTGSPPDS